MHRLKTALRSLWRHKTYSLVNITGLAVGMGVCLIVLMYVYHERTYDGHIPSSSKIYRVHSEFNMNSQTDKFAKTGVGLGPLLKREYPFIENYTRLLHIDENILFKSNYTKQYESSVAIADSNYFKVFDIKLLKGNPSSCLSKPQSIVISESFAKKFFGDSNPVGQYINTNNYQYTVTGIMPDWPANTHHKFSALISAFHESLSREEYLKSLWRVDVHTFLKLNKKQAHFIVQNFPDFYWENMSSIGERLGGSYAIKLVQLPDVHFTEGYDYDQATGDRAYLYAFGTIGIVILILAVINYVNISTARGIKRAREASMRRILGSEGKDIVSLVLMESVVLSLIALFLAFVLVEIVLELSPLNVVISKDLSLDFARFDFLWWAPLLMSLTVGLAGGIYPALRLSGTPVLFAIKGNANKKKINVRKALVGFQCTISVAVVIAAVFMFRQMEFVKHKNLGFNREDLLLVTIPDSVAMDKIPLLREKLSHSQYVAASAMALSVPGNKVGRSLFNIENESGALDRKVADLMRVGDDYFETMEIEFERGHSFSDIEKQMDIGVEPVIVNQALADNMGWDDPIGKNIDWGFDEKGVTVYSGKVIGVVKNFNTHSLHETIEPTVIFYNDKPDGTLHLRLNSNKFLEALEDVEGIWASINPSSPFQFSFLNKDLMQLYEEEQKQSRLVLYLTYLAILISLLGIAGMASFSSSLRAKDIGIRKVLGANSFQLINLVFKDMVVIILLSVVLALPLAYFLIKIWLSNFVFATPVNHYIFVISAIIAILLAYLVVSYHALKVIRTKSVDILKYD